MMVPNKFKLSGIFLFFLVFGVVVEGFGQVTRDCFIGDCDKQNDNQFQLFDIKFTDSQGNPLDLSTCPRNDEIHITFRYNTGNLNINQVRRNVYFQSNLQLEVNVGDDDEIEVFEPIPFDFFIPTLPATGRNNDLPHTQQVIFPDEFDCQRMTAILSDISIHWSNPGNSNQPGCGGFNYPGGQCRALGSDDTRVITSDELFYSFIPLESCFLENNRVLVRYVLTNLAGGNGQYDITWTINQNGNISTASGRLPDSNLRFVVVDGAPGDVIQVSVDITDTSTPERVRMDNPPAPRETIIPVPFPVNIQVFPNVGDVTPAPNGSIRLTNIDPSLFEEIRWERSDGSRIEDLDDPTNVTGLGDGTYFLIMRDLNGIERCFSRTITFVPTPVIYANLSLDFNPNARSVNFRWSTTKEWEASHFEVQRAVRGTQFEKIGEVKAAGWSDQLTEYRFEDKFLPLTGGNLLYRLKQVDFNGDFEYSKTLSIRVPGMQFTQGVWRVFPNPTDGSLLRVSLLDRSQYQDEAITFRLIHPFVQTAPLTVDTESAMNEAIAPLLERMPNGVFVLEIQWGQRIEHIKVIKKN